MIPSQIACQMWLALRGYTKIRDTRDADWALRGCYSERCKLSRLGKWTFLTSGGTDFQPIPALPQTLRQFPHSSQSSSFLAVRKLSPDRPPKSLLPEIYFHRRDRSPAEHDVSGLLPGKGGSHPP